MSGQVNDLSMHWELRGLFSDVEVCPLLVELSVVSRVDSQNTVIAQATLILSDNSVDTWNLAELYYQWTHFDVAKKPTQFPMHTHVIKL